MGQFQIRAKICVSKRRTKILIKLKDRAILCVKSGEFMVFPTSVPEWHHGEVIYAQK